MYCDGSFGPIMIRKKYLSTLGSKYKSKEELISFFMNEGRVMRVVHCPDCMFYVTQSGGITKESFQHVAQRFKMTRLKIEHKLDLTYTCNDVAIKCHQKWYVERGLALPPCCMNVLSGLTLAIISEFRRANLSICLDS